MFSARILLLATTVAVITVARSEDGNIAAMFPAIMELERESMKEPCDDNSDQTEYDFIIIGAGTAGCVVANRLTEVEEWDVLLLEAGGEEPFLIDVPSLSPMLFETDVIWRYRTVPSKTNLKSFENQQGNYATGKIMGGSTAVNSMVSVRGSKHAYDNWESLGNTGWEYDDVLPYFKKVEQIEIPELRNSSYHSTKGNIKVSYAPYRSEIVTNFLEAAEEMGNPEIDYDGESQTGASVSHNTMGRNGVRWSSSRGYLHPIRNRQNLHVKKRALVTRILINEDTRTASGVQFTKGGKNYTAHARKEVILSAGAIKSPQLLMISGIGPREHLEEFGITVIQDSKVGYHAMDHGMFYGLIFTINETIDLKLSEIITNPQKYLDNFINGKGPLSNTWGSSIVHAFLELEDAPLHSPGWPVLAGMFLYPSLVTYDEITIGYGMTSEVLNEFFGPLKNMSSYQIISFPLRPTSRGRISLQDSSIDVPPLLDPNIYSEKEDIDIAVAGIRKLIKITETPALQKVGSKLYDVPLPACKDMRFNSDEYWRCAVVQMSPPSWHISGTCKMGPTSDKTAVIDPQLKVYGIKGLRVIDASIFPDLPSPYTQMPTYMVGERGADFIKADHSTQ